MVRGADGGLKHVVIDTSDSTVSSPAAVRSPQPASRFLFTVQPGYGHLYPLVPLVQAAQRAGHEVLIATSAAMCPAVVAAGLPCAPAGMDWLLSEERRAFPEMADLPFGDKHFRLQLTHVFRDVTARRMVPDLLDLCRSWQPDVIVRDDQELGGLIAAELLGIPHAVAGVLWLYPPELRTLVSDAVATLLADYSLTGMPPLECAYRYLTLASMPPGWVGPGEQVPSTTHALRPVPFYGAATAGLPHWLDDLPPQPTVHANLGTIIPRVTDLGQSLLEAFHDAPYNLIMSVGSGHDPVASQSQPPNIRVIDHIPYGLLERCDAAIVHAGYGSAMSAITSGVPMVLLPVAADQPRNARRCEELGIGIALADDQRAPQQISAAVAQVLEHPGFRANSRQLLADVGLMPGPEAGVALLEQLSLTREPIPVCR
jgi:UDP:flavonoid glycosyltransferase YjiC (YdhE family)